MPLSHSDDPKLNKAATGRRVRGPSLEKTAQTQQAIARAALGEFLHVGIARATMARIAQRAQVAKGTIYLYFKSKDELLEGVIELAFSQSLFELENKPVLPGESIQRYLRRTLLPLMRTMESSGRADLARLVLAESRLHPALATLYRDRIYTPWTQHLTRLLAQALAQGELPNDAVLRFPPLMASSLWMGMVHNGMIDPAHPVDISAMFEAFLDMLFATPTHGIPCAAAAPPLAR